DIPTLRSAFPNFQISTKADVVAALTLEGKLLTSTARNIAEGNVYADLVARADADANSTANGYGYIDGELYSLVVAPVRTPDIIAWFVIGFRIDRPFAQSLKEQTGIDVSFFDHQNRPLASTLNDAVVAALAQALPRMTETRMSTAVPLAGQTALVSSRKLAAGEKHWATLTLQYSLDEKLRPAREAENLMLWV